MIRPSLTLATSPSKTSNILVTGATGTTGLRVIQGLIDVGWKPGQLRIVTRNVNKPKIQALKKMGFDVFQADMERPGTLDDISKGCIGCYVHSTSKDIPDLDTLEELRAKNLCAAIARQGSIRHVIYNSAAAGKNHGVKRIAQKHAVEDVFCNEQTLSFTALRANFFMEELWKRYTRPSILKGIYPLPCNRKKQLYLTSVRDMGRLAGTLLAEESPDTTNKVINVASDCLTGPEIAKAFADAQQKPCHYARPWRMEWKARWKFPELHEQIQFIKKNKEVTDIQELQSHFTGLLTPFNKFLEETKW
eukprot:CAMPEP_0183296224 /NCGR_PEP_ID=MMETSP0160_2-20130417/3876_1 /TAXON_ID=2839 ORGANISM="Odontella Sinensis, Strain Grunow 1884" /NCGR_SAMPLE_ID=MMETSP0160_2 /ASSEMBLY_ACC=CAM_ASM_000250 /LENGTH=304 /DNA_ID=CAMNT_0025457817 /DNA_START=155 /DNA_END=1066 /DNA_ORIENTATION=+